MSNTLTKHELVSAISAKTGVTLGVAHIALNTALDTIQLALVNKRKVEFRGFGILRPAVRKARKGRNPRNLSAGSYDIPQRNVVKFKMGMELDEAMNKAPEAVPAP